MRASRPRVTRVDPSSATLRERPARRTPGGHSERYALTFRAPLGHRDEEQPDVVVVQRTAATGPGGHPVYSDESRIVRAEISDRGEVRMLATGGHQTPRRPVAVRILPTA